MEAGSGSPAPATGVIGHREGVAGMFVFYSNKFGCLGSILISVALTAVLVLALRSCGG